MFTSGKKYGVAFAVGLMLLWCITGVSNNAFAAKGDSPRPSKEQHLVRGHKYSPDNLLVKFRAGVTAEQAEAVAKAGGASETKKFKRPRKLDKSPIDSWRLVKVGKGADMSAVRANLMKNPAVELVEYDYEVKALLEPNDPLYPQLWGLNNIGQTGGTPGADIDAPLAWNYSTGSSNVLVAVIDTGVDYTHPDLINNIWTNPGEIPGDGIDNDGNGYIDDVHGYDFVNYDGDPFDDMGHGTHCSGTIAAEGNNGIGVAGVNWQAKIMGVKFLDANGSGYTSGAISSVLYAVNNGAKVLSNSWGGGFDQALMDAITTANEAGVLFVAAAGNNYSNNDVYANYPSNYDVPNVIAVAATDHNDAKAAFSNYGLTTVDLGAPGVDILSTVPAIGAACCSDPSRYKLLSGTSMATPHISGAAALLIAQFPGTTHLQVKDRLLNGVDPVNSMAGITVTGGRLNVLNAIEAGTDTVPPDAVNNLAPIGSSGRSVTVTWTATGDDGMIGNASSYDLRYSIAPIDETNFSQATPASGEPKPAAPGTLETFKISGLKSATAYYFALKVLDNAGNASGLSNVVSAATQNVAVIFNDDMELGGGKWTIAGTDGVGGPALWHLSTHRSNSPSTAFYYGKESTLTYDTGATNYGSITSAPIDLQAAKDSWLSFTYFLQTENLPPYDTARVQISSDNGATWSDLFATANGTNGLMVTKDVDISAYDGKIVQLRFDFNTGDSVYNYYEGWVVDDVQIASTAEDDTTPPAAVSDLSADAIGGNFITLSWTATADDGTAGEPAASYDMRYSMSPIDDANFEYAPPVSGLPIPGLPGTKQFVTVSGLASNTTYYFALKVIDNVGNKSGLSNVLPATTKNQQFVTVFSDDMESGGGKWTIDGTDGVGGPALWHLSTHRSNSPNTAFYYGKESTLTYDTGATNYGSITSMPIDLTGVTQASLSFQYFLATENLPPYDTARAQISTDGGIAWTDLYATGYGTNGEMVKMDFDLSVYDGKVVQLRFDFNTGDPIYNNFEGWVVDDVVVTGWITGTVPNQPPVANAGGPYTSFKNVLISFDGSNSYDPESKTLTYLWDFGDGSTGTGVIPTHSYAASGTYTVTLVVNDGELGSNPVTTTATIINQPPVANPGGPYSGSKKQPVTFNGSGSSDPDGDALTYLWSFGDGSTGTGVNPTHSYAASGTYTVTLVVNDGELGSNPVTTTATIINQPPVANPGGPYSGSKKQPVTFNGSGSSDPDGDALTYLWSFGDGSTGTGVNPTHSYAASGTYTVTLVVNDGELGSDPMTTTATIINQPPVANPGGPYSGLKNQPIAFKGSASSDPDGDALTYRWNFGDGTIGIGENPSHSYAASGTYTVTLVVNDGQVDSEPATTTATIINQPPVANAGVDQTVVQRNTVFLNGSASYDPDGLIAKALWRQISGTPVTLVNSGQLTASFTAPRVTANSIILVFELTVTDDDGVTASDQVTITVVKK